jgi:hypothetical protein
MLFRFFWSIIPFYAYHILKKSLHNAAKYSTELKLKILLRYQNKTLFDLRN